MEQLFETLGTLFLVGGLVVILYAFYRLLKFSFTAVKDNDD